VLLIDGHPTNQSTLNRQAHWGESVEQLLQNTSLLLSHSHPAKSSKAEVRLICYSADEQTKADPGSLLWLVTHLRHFYKHIIVDLPHEHQALLTDTLSFMDRVVVTSHRQHLNDLNDLLTRLESTHSVSDGLLAVTGWAGHFRMGEWWRLEKRTGWKVGSLIDEQNRQDGIERLARRVANLRVGIAWGGGTARGWALAGIANALQQLNVPMDMFAGTSAGALGAAVYGLSLNYEIADQQMRSILPYLERTTRFFPPLTLSRYSLFAESWWNNLIQTFVGKLTFDDMLVPYAAVALDLETGQQKVFKRGLLWKAIRASSSVPILAPPMVIDGRSYSDGGVINAIPLDVVKDMGADILIGIDLTGREKAQEWNASTKPPMLPTLIRTINVAYNTAASRTMPLADVMIHPALRAAAVYDVSVMDEFMAEGERATLEALAELRQVMPWLE
jgi:NTE family protein